MCEENLREKNNVLAAQYRCLQGKMKDGLTAGGKELETVPPVYEIRVRKKGWIGRNVGTSISHSSISIG